MLGMEAIVHAASSEEIEQAVAAGAKLVACSVSLRDAVPKDVGAVALLDARVENPEGTGLPRRLDRLASPELSSESSLSDGTSCADLVHSLQSTAGVQR